MWGADISGDKQDQRHRCCEKTFEICLGFQYHVPLICLLKVYTGLPTYPRFPLQAPQRPSHFIPPVESLPPAVHIYAMSNSSGSSVSDNPNAPQIPPSIYLWERGFFGGTFVAAALYGKLIRRLVYLYSSFPSTRHPRGCYRFVLQMYGRLAWSCRSRQGEYQMGTRGSHCCHVLILDNTYCDVPQRITQFLRRWSRVFW